MEKVTQGTEVKTEDPTVGMGVELCHHAGGSKLAFRIIPSLSSLLTCLLASFGVAQDSSQNE